MICPLQWLRYQKQRLLWDESWIIDFTAIKQGTVTNLVWNKWQEVKH